MHRALDVDDILHEIFTHLATPSNPENPVPPGAELLQAALSCRRFRVHALKPLYDDLPSIKPLLRLLGTEDELREEVIPHDRWIKFAEYSCWVSSVDIFLEDFPTQIFPQVYCLLGGRPLLPSLQHLTLRLPRWHATPRVVIMSLAAPTIRSLHILVPRPAAEALRMDSGEDITLITAKQQDSIIDTLLSTIAYASPTGLECIRIVGSRPRSRITSCISQFSSLRVLDIPSRMDLGTEAVALSLTAETMGQLTMFLSVN
ncbi:hypothetical protein NEOLEDRAFT_784760 [Neolentinus lepideus HHB14362 ss-1]|uniref:F-box domain-containing protein n=1 Tax=Neolentinus lepideus HHB14362 ss-1 TaxID=1314782 RepID=A0A165UXW5_9AGAM|nr:hypothetical protein NEOLEDRAFT_784760 [Neolentinus lepideus HHB14362 ss-1]